MEAKHSKRVLQFSGGKDSVACLLLMEPQLDDITVMWVNAGAAFPETIEQMEKVRAMCPHFMEIKSDQPAQIEERGYPVDLLPVVNHPRIQQLTSLSLPKLQTFFDCCWANIMGPMYEATKAIGATEIIRGQKRVDGMKAPISNGDVIDGVRYTFPIEDWTDDDVYEFVRNSDLMLPHYRDGANTSLDCWSCTAYRHHNQWKLPYLQKHHPTWAREVERRNIIIKQQVEHVTGGVQ